MSCKKHIILRDIRLHSPNLLLYWFKLWIRGGHFVMIESYLDWIAKVDMINYLLFVTFLWGMLLPSKRITVRMTSYYKLTSLNFLKSFISVILLFILCVVMWRLPYNSVLFTIWCLKLALCCPLKFPYLLRMCSFPRIVRKVMEFDFFWSWKVMEFELPKRVWTLVWKDW